MQAILDFLWAHIIRHKDKQVGGLQAKLATSITVNSLASESEEDEENSQKLLLSQGPPVSKTTPRQASPVQESSQSPGPQQQH